MISAPFASLHAPTRTLPALGHLDMGGNVGNTREESIESGGWCTLVVTDCSLFSLNCSSSGSGEGGVAHKNKLRPMAIVVRTRAFFRASPPTQRDSAY